MYTKIGNEKKRHEIFHYQESMNWGADVIVLIPDELKFKAETLLGMNNVVEEWQRMIH